MPSLFDKYAARFGLPYRQATLAERGPDGKLALAAVELVENGQTRATLPATLHAVRQDDPELDGGFGQLQGLESRRERLVDLMGEDLRAKNVWPRVHQQLRVDGELWTIRRIVSESAALVQVEVTQIVEHRAPHQRAP